MSTRPSGYLAPVPVWLGTSRRASTPPRAAIPGGGFSLGAIVPALAFADAARRPERAWEETGESRTRWLAEIALVPVVGSWRYMTSVKPLLEAAEKAWDLAGG